MGVTVRGARPEDLSAIALVHQSAFGGRASEGRLVGLLHAAGKAAVSMVACEAEEIVGHVVFSTVSLEPADSSIRIVGLGPIAVLPAHQRKGNWFSFDSRWPDCLH
jgi:putative acetyltransferase